MYPFLSTHQDFWLCVDIQGPDDCWPWKRGLDGKGYGAYYYEGKMQIAHRLALKFALGEELKYEATLHLCDYKPCCNPQHLLDGSQLKNMRHKATGNIQKQGNLYVAKVGRNPPPSRRRSFPTRGEAEAWLRELLAEYRNLQPSYTHSKELS